MTTTTGPTDDLLARARRALPGGTVHTFSNRPRGFPAFMDQPDFIIERGEGAYVWTTDGERMLDMVLGAGRPPRPRPSGDRGRGRCPGRARSPTTSTSPPEVVDAAELVVSTDARRGRACASSTPAPRRCSSPSGWSARTPGRDRLIKLEGAYHGNLDDVLFHSSFGAVDDWGGDIPAPDTPGIPAGCGRDRARALQRRRRDGRGRGGTARRGGRDHRGADHARHRARARLPRRGPRDRRSLAPAARLRRGDHRLPPRAGRRAGVLRRARRT